jgi:predicted patatin/cPLA2 family phospholipase
MTRREEKRAVAQSTQQSESQDKPTRRSNVEARRGDYEWLAQALINMHKLESERVHQTLDVDLSDKAFEEEGDKYLLSLAMDRHLLLAFESVYWYSPEAMRLYVEMRLLADEQRAERKAASKE